MSEQEKFLAKFVGWAKMQENILAAALVGSLARGTARADSDVDLILITKNPNFFIDNHNWIKEFGNIKTINQEDFKAVQVLRVFYVNGLEVEFGMTTAEWLKQNPLDSGTQRVLEDGYKVLDDKANLFSQMKIKPI